MVHIETLREFFFPLISIRKKLGIDAILVARPHHAVPAFIVQRVTFFMPFDKSPSDVPKIDFFDDRRQGCFDYWREQTSPLYDTTPAESPDNTGLFKMRGFCSPRGIVSTSEYDATSLRLTKRHSGVMGDTLFVQRFVTGGAVGMSADAPFSYRPGDVSIIDFAHQFEGLHQVSHVQCVFLKKASLGFDPDKPVPLHTYPAGSVMARLLNAELDRLYRPLLAGECQLSEATFDRFEGCVKMAFTGAPVDGDVRTQARNALRDLVCAYIERSLASPELTTAAILREFGVSRATLYRMFESENGVRNYISNRRLFRAVFEISASPARRGLIHEIAERWGFSSDASFSRSVRRAYGTSPGKIFDRPHANVEAPSAAHPNSRITRLMNTMNGAPSVAA